MLMIDYWTVESRTKVTYHTNANAALMEQARRVANGEMGAEMIPHQAQASTETLVALLRGAYRRGGLEE